jgi:hypothetical protein
MGAFVLLVLTRLSRLSALAPSGERDLLLDALRDEEEALADDATALADFERYKVH